MRDSLDEPLPLKRIARKAGVDMRKLHRMFRQGLGQSPSAHYLDLRLDRARDLLASTTIPVAEVGLACGFSSPHWFSRAYLRRFGLPPRKHRALLRSPLGAGRYR